VENAGALTALQSGNLSAALEFTDRISQDPEVALRGKQGTEVTITLEGLEDLVKANEGAAPIIDITPQVVKEKENE